MFSEIIVLYFHLHDQAVEAIHYFICQYLFTDQYGITSSRLKSSHIPTFTRAFRISYSMKIPCTVCYLGPGPYSAFRMWNKWFQSHRKLILSCYRQINLTKFTESSNTKIWSVEIPYKKIIQKNGPKTLSSTGKTKCLFACTDTRLSTSTKILKIKCMLTHRHTHIHKISEIFKRKKFHIRMTIYRLENMCTVCTRSIKQS
jgi:hypothetical protein